MQKIRVVSSKFQKAHCVCKEHFCSAIVIVQKMGDTSVVVCVHAPMYMHVGVPTCVCASVYMRAGVCVHVCAQGARSPAHPAAQPYRRLPGWLSSPCSLYSACFPDGCRVSLYPYPTWPPQACCPCLCPLNSRMELKTGKLPALMVDPLRRLRGGKPDCKVPCVHQSSRVPVSPASCPVGRRQITEFHFFPREGPSSAAPVARPSVLGKAA